MIIIMVTWYKNMQYIQANNSIYAYVTVMFRSLHIPFTLDGCYFPWYWKFPYCCGSVWFSHRTRWWYKGCLWGRCSSMRIRLCRDIRLSISIVSLSVSSSLSPWSSSLYAISTALHWEKFCVRYLLSRYVVTIEPFLFTTLKAHGSYCVVNLLCFGWRMRTVSLTDKHGLALHLVLA